MVVNPALLQNAQAIIFAAVDLHNFEMLLEQFDRRHELGTLQPIAIQIVRFLVGSRYQHQSLVEQSLQQIAHQHRITDVGDMEFVKAEQAQLLRYIAGDVQQRIFLTLQIAQPVMDVLHEAVEVHPALAFDRYRIEERVHQETFPPTHATPEIEAAHRPLAQKYAQ